jgi:protein SCO1
MPRLNRWWIVYAVVGLLIGLGAVVALGLALRPHTFGGTLLQSARPAFDFLLAGPDERSVRLSDFEGQVVLLFFGYTSCPDVCPTTMKEMGQMLKLLGQDAEVVQVIFISVDPEMDTTQRLQGYLSVYDERILGLTGTPEDIFYTATQYGIFYQKKPYGDQGAYLIDHTATLLLIDPKGYLKLVYPYGTPAQAIASDVRYILRH